MDSNTTTRKKPRTSILTLPTEILQQIAGDCSDETLIQLRLTCKTIEAAVLNQFTATFFSKLEGFMLDEARLTRIKNIISNPNTATHLRLIALTMSANDGERPLQVVPKPDQNRAQVVCETVNSYEQQQYDRHECKTGGISLVAQNLVHSIIAMIAQHKKSAVILDMCSENDVRVLAYYPQLLRDLLNTLHRYTCPVSGLCMTDRFPLEVSHFVAQGAPRRVTKQLKGFEYAFKPSAEADLQTTQSEQHWLIVSEIVKHSTKLKRLILDRTMGTDEILEGSVLLGICTWALAGPAVGMLRRLTLIGLNMPAATLACVLKVCRETLQKLTLGLLQLVGAGDVYGEVFSTLVAMPRLKKLLCYALYRHEPDVQTIQLNDLDMVAFLAYREDPERYGSMPDQKAMEAKPFLKLNTESAIIYV